jgi:hypothetical protein
MSPSCRLSSGSQAQQKEASSVLCIRQPAIHVGTGPEPPSTSAPGGCQQWTDSIQLRTDYVCKRDGELHPRSLYLDLNIRMIRC